MVATTPAFAVDDTTPPTLTDVRVVDQTDVNAPSVNITNGDRAIGVTISATDDLSGVAGISVTAGCVTACTGTGPSSASAPVSWLTGPDNKVEGTATLTIPQSARTGTWKVASVDLVDKMTNGQTVTSLGAYDATRAFVVAKTADSTGPALNSATLAGSTLDTTTADKPVAFTIEATDSVPGVDHGSVLLSCTSGCGDHANAFKEFDFSSSDLQTGSSTHGQWVTDTASFSYVDTGTWTVPATGIDLYDGYGNHTQTTSSTTLTVTAAADALAPTVSGTPSFSPDTANATTDDAATTLNIDIDDGVSGFSFGSGTLDDGAGNLIFFSITPDMNAVGTDHYAVPITVPALQPVGDYTITDLVLADRYGNASDPSAPATPVLHVTTSADSSTGPSLVGALSLGPNPLNVHDAYLQGRPLAVAATITDDASGFAHATLNFRDAADQPVSASDALLRSDLRGGTVTQGSYLGFVYPADLSPNVDGTWHLDSIDLYDRADNKTTDTSVAQPFVVHATEPHDASAPVLTALTVSPSSVTTTDDPASVHVHITATDAGSGGGDASGIWFGSVTLESPDGTQFAESGDFAGASQLTSGTDISGAYDLTMTIPKWDEPGTWKVTDVQLYDNAGNSSDYAGSALFAIAGTPQVSVAGPVDVHAPVLTGLVASPVSVNTATSGKVSFTVSATDNQGSNDGSGVSGGSITMVSPLGKSASAFFSSGDRVSGTAESGTYTTQLTLPKYSDSGTWHISVSLSDGVGNDSESTSADITALGSSNTSTVSVTGAPDTHGPVVANVHFNPTSVTTTSGPQPLLVEVHLTDNQLSSDGSGVDSAEILLTSPHGTQADMADGLDLVSGTANDGWWEGRFTVPKFVDPGTWTISNLTADDVAGNETSVSAPDLTGSGLTSGVTITGPPDTAAPSVAASGITVPVSPVDVTVADTQMTVGIHAVDTDGSGNPGSGVASGYVVVRGPNGSQELGELPDTPASGTTDGTWNVPITIHKFTDNGTWHVYLVHLVDISGNERDLTGVDLNAFSTGFTVTSNPDTSGPTLTSLSFNPASTDVSTGNSNVTVTLGATDSGSGFGGAFVVLQSPSQTQQASANFPSTPTTGTAFSGTFTTTVQIPQYGEPGTWTVTELDMWDGVDNETDYPTPTQFPSSNVTTTLPVTDSNADTVAPAVVGGTISPSPIDVSGGQVQATVDLNLTDDKSGVQDGWFDLVSPTGVHTSHDIGTRVSGSPTSGHWSTTVPFGVHSENGTWSIASVHLTDAAGNAVTRSSSPLPISVNVSGGVAVVPGTPTNLGGTVGNAHVDLSWGAPADNGGSAITGYNVLISPARSGHSAPDAQPFSAQTFGTVTGLTNGTAYTFQVQAINAVGPGNYSAPTSALTPQPVVPSAPFPVNGNAGNTTADMTWGVPGDDGGSPITGYKVWISPSRNGQPNPDILTFNSTATTQTIPGLTNGVPYTFKVAAVNAVGTGPYSSASGPVTPFAPTLPAPTVTVGSSANPVAFDHQPITYTVSVSGGSGTPTGNVTLSVGGLQLGSATALANGVATFQDVVRNPGSYPVVASYAGNGTYAAASSNQITQVVTAVAPSAPTALSGVPAQNAISVSFTPGSTGGASTTYVATAAPAAGGTPISSTVGGGSPLTISGLTAGTSYSVTVTATNAAGSTTSSAITVTTLNPPAPGAPTITNVAPGVSSFAVSFTAGANSGAGTTFTVSAVPTAGGSAATASGTSPITVSGLASGTSYQVTVTATNAGGSTTSAPVTASTAPADAVNVNTGTTGSDGTATATSSDGSGETVAATMTGDGSVTTGWYTGPPTGAPGLQQGLHYFDVYVTPAASGAPPSQVSIQLCNVPHGSSLKWLNAANSYQAVSAGMVVNGACVSLLLNGTTSPSINELKGTVFAVVDAAAPTARTTKPAATTSLTKLFTVAWSGSDTGGSGLTTFDVRYTKATWNGKPGAPAAWLNGVKATSATWFGSLGYEYCFSTRAHDAAGNVSGWGAAKCTALPLDERSLKASAGWSKVGNKSAYNGTLLSTKASGKTLTLKGATTGRSALVVTKAKGAGSIVVLYNGKAVTKTISLGATKTLYKRLITLPKVAKANTTIVIKSTTGKPVQIDGLLLARV